MSSGASVSVAGSKCARHFDMPALSVCDRCGDFLCLKCLNDDDGGLYCPACAALLPALAPPGTRVAADLIDRAALLFTTLAITIGAIAVMSGDSFGEVPYEWVITAFMFALIPICALQLWLVHENGQSIGKRIMGVRVVMLDGRPASVVRVLLLRNVLPLALGLVPLIGMIFRIANIAALFSEGNRALHDRMAGTKVMKVDKKVQ